MTGTYYNPGEIPTVQAKASSARECGCDSGAGWVCRVHQEIYEAAQAVMLTGPSIPEPKGDFAKGIRQPSPYSDMCGVFDIPLSSRNVGIGGAPTRPSTMPTTAAERKQYPIATGVLDYFPDAIVALAHLSWVGNQQHNPGQPLHWDRTKSTDEADTTIRHFMERGTLDKDGVRHSVKFAWRALALLQKEIEAEQA